MKPLLIVAIVALVGCRTPPVACDVHLTPINLVAKASVVPDGKETAAAQRSAPTQPAQAGGR